MGAKCCLQSGITVQHSSDEGADIPEQVACFLPCRAGSERIPHKNIKPFAGSSLIQIKLEQLVDARLIDRIIVSTNDPAVYKVAESFHVSVDWRPEHLCRNDTGTDELIGYVSDLVSEAHILWTHVTSPFVGGELYDELIQMYLESTRDSLMTVNEIRGFLWRDGPLNYDRRIERWPRTQTIDPVYEINSAAFIAPIEAYRAGDRIGNDPMLYPLDWRTGLDIDYPDDFALAELLYENRLCGVAGPGNLQCVQE